MFYVYFVASSKTLTQHWNNRITAASRPLIHWVPSRVRSESAALGVCVYIRVLPIHFDRETVPSALIFRVLLAHVSQISNFINFDC